jgi:hypothetical protein
MTGRKSDVCRDSVLTPEAQAREHKKARAIALKWRARPADDGRLDDTKPWRWIWLAMTVFTTIVLIWWFRGMLK